MSAKLIPDTPEGTPIEVDETTRLMNLNKKDLIEIISSHIKNY